jgi:hypothetical protein
VLDIVTAMESIVDTAIAGGRPAGGAPECTLGARIVWRAAELAAARGADPVTAAEAGLRAGAAYVRLAAELQATAQAREADRCVELFVNELRDRAVEPAQRLPGTRRSS